MSKMFNTVNDSNDGQAMSNILYIDILCFRVTQA